MALRIDHATELRAGDVIHRQFTALSAEATVADVQAWFAASAHRQMAFLADGERYVGSLTRGDLEGAPDPNAPASRHARHGPTIAPDAPARAGFEIAISTDARRVPVVTDDGTLLGVLSVTADLTAYCGVAPATPGV
jgi:CBS domain-containing protein